MRLFDKLLKRNQEEKVEQVEQVQVEESQKFEGEKRIEIGCKQILFKKYPNGFTFEELQQIDFSKFGQVLKQKQLLPPSYDRKPASVDIRLVGDIPRVKLTFKSKTSDSYWTVAIYRYDVSFAKQGSEIYKSNYLMQEEWINFAERMRWCMKRGFNTYFVNQI